LEESKKKVGKWRDKSGAKPAQWGKTEAKPTWLFERKLLDLFRYGLGGGCVVVGRGKGWQKTKGRDALEGALVENEGGIF